jgi:hypothetical protein
VSFVSTLSDLYSTVSRFLGDSTRRMVGEGANEIVHRLPAASEESGHDRVQGRIGLCLRILTLLGQRISGTGGSTRSAHLRQYMSWRQHVSFTMPSCLSIVAAHAPFCYMSVL